MARVIKRIGNREYYYDQKSTRVDGKVVTKSTYISPVTPKRKRGGGFGFVGFGLAALAISKLKGELKPYTPGKTHQPAHPRSIQVMKEQKHSLEKIQAQARFARIQNERKSGQRELTEEEAKVLKEFASFVARASTPSSTPLTPSTSSPPPSSEKEQEPDQLPSSEQVLT